MHSLASIRRLNRQVGERAKRKGTEPMTFTQAQIDEWKVMWAQGLMPPMLLVAVGTHRPDGWIEMEEVDGAPKRVLLDKTGLGYESEPAMTIGKFLGWIDPGPEYGYAVVEEGPFQAWVQAFRKAE